MTNLEQYNSAFTAKLDEQLSVYVTIGTPITESPMWFLFAEFNRENKSLKFKSSQNGYMYFSIPLKEEDEGILYYKWETVADYFRSLKYSHIKENWPTVYYELRPNEKPIEKPVVKDDWIHDLLDSFAEIKGIENKVKRPEKPVEVTDYEKQATDFLTLTGTSFTATYKKYDYYFKSDKERRAIFSIVLKNKTHRYRFLFGQSIAAGSKVPTPYDVLSCLTKYDIGSYANFCSDFGYDIKNSKSIYKAVLREWKNIELLFTAEQIELLQEIN